MKRTLLGAVFLCLVPTVLLSMTLTDMAGRSVTVGEVKRAVAVGPGILRLFFYLDAQDTIGGIEEAEKRWDPIGKDYSMTKAFDALKDLPVIGPGGPGKPPVPELILKVKPDLVVMSSVLMEVYDPDRLQAEIGCPVMVLGLGTPGYVDVQGLKKALTALGKALNREERARELGAAMEGLVSDLDRRTKPISSRPKVYVGAVSFKGAQPFTSTQYPYPPLMWLNTPMISDRYAKAEGYLSLEFEVFFKEQPEVVFIDEGNLELVKEDFKKDPRRYCLIKAFRDGHVYGVLPFNYYWTNVSTAFADAYFIGKVLYPEGFKDVDPIRKADEIFKTFLGEPLYEKFLGRYPGFKTLKEEFVCR